MRFSVIIPTCNRPDLLSRCLESIISSKDFVNSASEIIISDDGSATDAKSIVETYSGKFNIVYIRGPQKGPAANRNNGASIATADWLVFIDDDCVPSSTLLYEYNQAITLKYGEFVFEGAIHPWGEKKRLDQEAPINVLGNRLWSCNFCIHRDFFLKIGGFNELFPYACMEDVDFYYRVKEICPPFFVQNAIVYHPWRQVVNVFSKWEKALISHKLFIQTNKSGAEAFKLRAFMSSMIVGFFKHTIPDIIRYRGRGIMMVLAFYYFEFRLFFFLLRRSIFYEDSRIQR